MSNARGLLLLTVVSATVALVPARPVSPRPTTATQVASAVAPADGRGDAATPGRGPALAPALDADEAYRADDVLSGYFAELLRATEVLGPGDLDDDDDPYGEEAGPEALEDGGDDGLPRGVPVGSHTNGRLLRGIPFPDDDPRFALLAPWRAYATRRLIDGLADAVDQVEVLYPGTPALTVGDVSRLGGGPLSPHMSHQIGLDVDIGPYWADGEVHPLRAMIPERLDIPRTWALLEALVSDEAVRYIIIDYRLQQVFYEYARELPWMDEEYLELIFQYPRGPRYPGGVIRHWEGHYSHIHVRFSCPDEFSDTCTD